MREFRTEVKPRTVFRLPLRNGPDGLLRHRGGVLHRLLHVDERPVVVRVAQPAPDRVVFGARCDHESDATTAIAMMRFALSVDDDLSDFHRRFKNDPLIGRSVRARPHLRCQRRPEPFEMLAWAVCEQLIDFPRAAAIERRIVRALGRAHGDLRDAPSARRLAGVTPALLQSLDLAHGRAVALIKASRLVASGGVDLRDPDHERGWRALRSIPGIGSWTLSMLALHGQGRYDALPAGDLGYVKTVGRFLGGGDPGRRSDEQEVLDFFAPYGEWKGLAGAHFLAMRADGRFDAMTRCLPQAGTRSSARSVPQAA